MQNHCNLLYREEECEMMRVLKVQFCAGNPSEGSDKPSNSTRALPLLHGHRLGGACWLVHLALGKQLAVVSTGNPYLHGGSSIDVVMACCRWRAMYLNDSGGTEITARYVKRFPYSKVREIEPCRVEQLAAERHVTMGQLSLAWILPKDAIAVVAVLLGH
ncbi:hypothetical protein BC834DRAFT_515322 [Gloeopeniophorella convolvens]|nr:hypothetical protein BC834DRAFT_515322 [Gloeopeniophorella convolvens]